jgi:TolA-binding protein
MAPKPVNNPEALPPTTTPSASSYQEIGFRERKAMARAAAPVRGAETEVPWDDPSGGSGSTAAKRSRGPLRVIIWVGAAFLLAGTGIYTLSRRAADDVPVVVSNPAPAPSPTQPGPVPLATPSRASAPAVSATPSPPLPDPATAAARFTTQPTPTPAPQRRTLQSAQTLEPPLPAEYHAGLSAAQAKDWVGAERAYRDALQESPSNPEIWYKLGVALSQQKRLPDAIAAYREALRLNPDHPKSWYNLGLELSRLRDYQPALSAFREVTRLEPNNARGWKIRGRLHAINKEPVEAITALPRRNPPRAR